MFITIKSYIWIWNTKNPKVKTEHVHEMYVSFWMRQCSIKTKTKKWMCLIYNDTFSHKMHSRRLNLFASSTLSRLGFEMRQQKRFYTRSNSWLGLLTCFILFVLNKISVFISFENIRFLSLLLFSNRLSHKTYHLTFKSKIESSEYQLKYAKLKKIK